ESGRRRSYGRAASGSFHVTSAGWHTILRACPARRDDPFDSGAESAVMVEVRPPKSSNFYRAHVTARVKWFDPAKGIGFVTPEDGSADAFLHVSRLNRAGVSTVQEGATLV